MAERIEVLWRCSTKALYKAKWTVFVQWWQLSNKDFNSTSKEQVDFLMYLFQERNLQLSTIDGCKTAIVDEVGNSFLNNNKEEQVSGQRDRPKGC